MFNLNYGIDSLEIMADLWEEVYSDPEYWKGLEEDADWAAYKADMATHPFPEPDYTGLFREVDARAA